MGKNKKKNKRKYSSRPASSQIETSASTSTEAIQIPGNSSQNVTESAAAAQSLRTPESELAVEAIQELEDAIIECMKVDLGLSDMTDLQRGELADIASQNSSTSNALNCNLNKLLSDKDPKFVENVEIYITLQSQLKFLKDHYSKANERKSISQDDSNEQIDLDTAVLQYRPNEMSLDLKIDERKKTDDDDVSAEIIKEARDSPLNIEEIAEDIPLVTNSNNSEKINSIQNEYGSIDSSQPDLERVWKLLDSKLNKYEKKRRSVELAVKIWKEKQDSTSPEKEMAAAIPKEKLDDATKESKEAADEVNAVIQKMKRVVIQKDKDAKPTDEIQTAEHTSEISSKGKTGKKDRSRDFQTSEHSPKNVTEGQKGAALKILNDKIDTLSPETDEWENYATGVSKEAADQVNDLIKELKTAEIGKVKMIEEKFTNKIQRAACFPGSTTETVAGTRDSNKSTGDLQVDDGSLTATMLSIATDNTTCEHMGGKRSLEKNQTKKMSKSDEVFKRDLKKFLKVQKAKLDEYLKECGFLNTKSKILKEQPSLSSEKDSATSEVEKQCDTKITEKPEVLSTEVKQNRTRAVPLDNVVKNDFDFQTDGDKYIKVENREFISSLEDDLEYLFKFNEKKVKVYFSADHMYVSTENGEFDIFVRKLKPADLKDDATQTDAKL